MNNYLLDKNLSMKAKGLLSVILSMPDDKRMSLSALVEINRDGVTAIRGTVQELEDCGYLSRRRVRDEQGRLTSTEYTVCKKPYKAE
jgi:hypothetical protein